MGVRRALVVANDEYTDPGLGRLASPDRDAAALSEVLGDPQVGGYAVRILSNAGVQPLREALESFFAEAERDDELLVHFSCHGLKDDANDLYLAASDTRPALLASTGLAADFVARRMRSSRARSVALFLDCCYGGAFERGMLARAGGQVPVLDAFEQRQLSTGAGRVVVTASSAVEYAFESGDLTDLGNAPPSIFTSALVQGISTGEADSDGSGTISVAELFAYAEQEVRRANPNQTPHMWSFGTRGDIVVAMSPLRRIMPAEIPSDIAHALDGDLASRLGAVHLLRGLLGERDPAVVLTARLALGRLADDDSRRLSQAAGEALERDRVGAEPSTLTFADLEVGVPSQPQTVTLTGSALAAAARVESKPSWVVVRQIGNRLDMTVSVDRPGDLSGLIVLTGPAGSLNIAITARAVEAVEPAVPTGSKPAAPAKTQEPAATAGTGPAVSRPERSVDGPARPEATPMPSVRRKEWIAAGWFAASGLFVLSLLLPYDGGGSTVASDIGSSPAGMWLALLVLAVAAGPVVAAAALRRPKPEWWGTVAGISAAAVLLAFAVSAVRDATELGMSLPTGVGVASGVVAVAAAAGSLQERRLVLRRPVHDAETAVTVSSPVTARPLRWIKGLWFAAAGLFVLLLFLQAGDYSSRLVGADRYSSSLAADVGARSGGLALLVVLVLMAYVAAGVRLRADLSRWWLAAGAAGVVLMLVAVDELVTDGAGSAALPAVGVVAAVLATAALVWAAVEARRARRAWLAGTVR